MISFSELLLHNALSDAFDRWLYHKVYNLVTRSSIARNATATLENMRRSMDEAGITKTACMPIPPFLTFEELKRAKEKDDGVIPFTGVEFTDLDNVATKLKNDVEQGAKGLKLHPIIQRTSLNSKKTFQVIEEFAPYQLPAVKIAKKACQGDKGLEQQIFYNNAVSLVGE